MRPARLLSFVFLVLTIAIHPAGNAGEKTGTIDAADYEALQKAGWHPDARIARLIRQARLGNTRAMTELGYRHTTGEGVLRGRLAAFDLYTRAAQAGQAEAQLYLAAMYQQEKNAAEEQALYWYRQSAARKNPIAMRVMADYLEAGQGMAADPEKAEALRREADEADPVFEAGMTLEEYDAALDKYRRAARQGIAVARYQLAVMYDHYFGPPSDDAVAYWYLQAARQGYVKAQLALGACYSQGKCGVTRDEGKAARWYRKACENGSREGCLQLEKHPL